MPRRSLLLIAPRTLAWEEEDFPPLPPEAVVVRTLTGAISVGAEVPQYRGEARGDGGHYPRMTGYESLGVVVARGRAVNDRQVGQRVLAYYGHRTHAVVPAARTVPVPADIPDDLALLAILSCDAMKGQRAIRAGDEDVPALITGAGTMGLLTLYNLRASGVHVVDVCEPDPHRRALALRLGARAALVPQDVHALAYTLGFECSSRDAAFSLLQCALRPEGRLCVTADGNLEPLVLTPDFHRKELTIRGSSDGWDYHAHAAWYFDTLREVPELQVALSAIFDLTISAAALASTFALLDAGEIHPVKVLVRY